MVSTVSADKDYVMPTLSIPSDKGRKAQRGTALIEFALVLPMLLIMTVAAVDFGRAFFVKNVVSQAAREGVRLRYADLRIRTFAARSMLYRTARLGDAGANIVNEGIACKVFATETVGDVVDTAIQLVGGKALTVGHPLERLYREVRALRLTEGASDVLRLNLVRGNLDMDKGVL